jgi:hypothetical protein
MRVQTLFASTLALLPVAALAAAPSDAYQAGYRVGRIVGQAMPFVVAGLVVTVVTWLVVRARSRRKHPHGTEPRG